MDRVHHTCLLLLLLLWPASVHAGTVAIVQLSSRTPDLTETLSRLHGELLSVGLQVKLIERPADPGPGRADSRAWFADKAAEDGLDAVIDIVGDLKPVAVDVWVFERSPLRFDVSRVTLETNTSNASETLAIRAVEVLRSTFLENDMALGERHIGPRAPPATTTKPSVSVQVEPSRHVERFGVTAGVLVLTSPGGVGPTIMPIAGFDWKVRHWLVLQAALAGLGSRPTVATAAGHARVGQQYGLLGGCFRFLSDKQLSPYIAFSAGALHTSVEGEADSPRSGHALEQWSFLMDGTFGMGLSMTNRYYLTLAAHVQLADPYVAVHIMDAVVATTGRPNFVLTLTVGAWL